MKSKLLFLLVFAFVAMFSFALLAQSPQTFTSTGTWKCPLNVYTVQVECWGGGANGGGCTGANANGGGGGGGAYAKSASISVIPNTVYTVTVGAQLVVQGTNQNGTAGNPSSFSLGGTTYTLAAGGTGGIASGAGSAGGTVAACTGDAGSIFAGGNGDAGGGSGKGGGGGGGAGNANPGGNASTNTGGSGGVAGGGAGATGTSTAGTGVTGTAPGGGGSGSHTGAGGTARAGGAGARGQVILTWTAIAGCTPPTNEPTAFTTSNILTTSVTVGWTRPGSGGGDQVIVIAKQGSAVDAIPVNNITYTAYPDFGNAGALIGTSDYVVYIGTGTSVNVTNLYANTAYYFAVYEFFNTGPCYYTSGTTPLTGNLTTANGPMAVSSATTTQDNDGIVATNTTDYQMIGIQIVTTAGTSPSLSLSQVVFNTTGSTTTADITGAKLFFTGTSSTFSNNSTALATISNPGAGGTFSGFTQTLAASSTNYFWIAYDISSGAATGNAEKCQCTSITVTDGTNNINPTLTSTTAASRIVSAYCAPPCNCSSYGDITNVTLVGESGTSINNSTACNNYTYYSSMSATLIKGNTYNLTISTGLCSTGNYYFKAWIDYNGNGVFDEPSEVLGTEYNHGGNGNYTHTTSFTVPSTSLTGTLRLRVKIYYNAAQTPCNASYGEDEDYNVNIINACTAPTTQASGTFNTTAGFTDINITNFTRGTGDNVLIVARQGGSAIAPINGTTYTADANFGDVAAGYSTGAGNYVVYNGAWVSGTTTLDVTSLGSGVSYTFDIYEYMNTQICYLTPSYTPAAVTTQSCTPPSAATTATSSGQTSSTMNVAWTGGGGTNTLVVARNGGSATAPTNGIVYTAATGSSIVYSTGQTLGTGKIVYNGAVASGNVTVTGLTPGVTYSFDVYSYNTSPNCYATVYTGTGTTTNFMTYMSSTTTQDNLVVNINTVSQQIIGLQVVTGGVTSPFNVTSITYNTTGTTNNATDIGNVRIYYTGTNATFSTTGQFGSTVVSPGVGGTVSGSQQLSTGTNYFWLTYDIMGTATLGDNAAGAVTSVSMDGGVGAQTPTNTATASRQISLIYCTASMNCNGTGGSYGTIYNVQLGTINNTTDCNSYTYYSSLSTNLTQGATYPMSVSIKTGDSYVLHVYIDYNRNGNFSDAGEMVYVSPCAGSGNNITYTFNVTVPANATLGTTRMRLKTYDCAPGDCTDPCNGCSYTYGEMEDYNVNIIASCTQPTTQASSPFVATAGYTDININSFTRGTGDNVMIVARLTTTSSAAPTNGVTYYADPNFGDATANYSTGTGNYVVYIGTGTSVDVTGLITGTSYTFDLYEYIGSNWCFLLPAYTPAAVVTNSCTPPTGQASLFGNANVTNTQMDISWARGNGADVLVVARTTATGAVAPSGGISYSADAVFGDATAGHLTGTGNYVVYNGTGTGVTVTNLIPNTSYSFDVYEYSTGPNCYKTPALTSTGITTLNVMAFISSTTTQNNSSVVFNTTGQEIVGLQVVTAGATSAFNLTSITFNTTGTTTPATDIANATIWYTTNSGTFATGTQFGTPGDIIANPNGSYTVTPATAQALTTGINYFWLAYDIPLGATINDYADAAITSITIDGGAGTKTPTSTATASRQIINVVYCIYPTGGYYWNGSQYNGEITNVEITGNGGSPVLFNNSTPIPHSYTIVGFDDQTSVSPPTLVEGVQYSFSVVRTIDNNSDYSLMVYIDYLNDGIFNGGNAPDFIYNSGDPGKGHPTLTFNYTIPTSGITTGLHRMRVSNRNTISLTDPCDATTSLMGVTVYGEREDFMVNIITCIAPTSVGITGGSTEICDGGDPGKFTATPVGGSPATYTYQWYKNGSTAGTASTYDPGILSAGTTSIYCAVSNGTGCTTNSDPVTTITVDATPAGGTASALPATLCVSGTTTISLTGSTGNIQWQKSPDNNNDFTNITGANSTTLSTDNLTSVEYYQAVVTSGSNGVCTPALSTLVTVNVNTISTDPTDITITPHPYSCPGSTVTLTETGGTLGTGTGAEWVWYKDNSGNLSSKIGTGNPYILTVSSTNDYYVRAEGDCSGQPSNWNPSYKTTGHNLVTAGVTTSVLNQPNSHSETENLPGAFSCDVYYSPKNSSYKWQVSTDLGFSWTDITYSSPYSTAAPVLNTPYSDSLFTITLNINPVSLGMTTYEYRCIITGYCGTVNSNAATLTVSPACVAVTVVTQPTPQAKCAGTPATFSLTAGTGDIPYTYQWYKSGTGPISLATLDTYTINSPVSGDAGNYYCIVTNCSGANNVQSNTVSLTVSALPTSSAVGSANPTSVCDHGNFTLSATGAQAGESYTWCQVPCSTNPLGSSSTYTANNVGATTQYEVSTYNTTSHCVSLNQSTITATVNNYPSAPTTKDDTLCGPGTIVLSASGAGGGEDYKWYSSTGTLLQTGGSTYTTGNLTSDTSFYVTKYNKGTGCESTPQTIINVRVNALPNLVITNPDTVCSPNKVNLTLPAVTAGSDAGLTLTYWKNAGATTPLSTPTAAGAGTYYIKGAAATGCYVIQPVTVVVTICCVAPTSASISGGSTKICEGIDAGVYTATGIGGKPTPYSYQWYLNNTLQAGETSSTYDPGDLSAGIASVYCAVSTGDVCATNSGTKTITVDSITPPTINGYVTVCQGDIRVQYDTQAGMTGYTWNISGGGQISLGAGTNLIEVKWNVDGNQWVSVNYTNGLGCTAASPTVYDVYAYSKANVLNQPQPQSVAAGQNTSFSINSSGVGFTYQWQISSDTGKTYFNITDGGTAPVISGSATNTLSLTGVEIDDNGLLFRCNVTPTSPCTQAVNSNAVKLTVNPTGIAGQWDGTIDTEWYKDGNWDSGLAPDATTDVVITFKTNEPDISSGKTGLCASLTINPQASVTVSAGGTLSCGETSGSGNLLIKSDVTGTGAFKQEDGAIVSIKGSVTVQRYIGFLGYHYISSPLAGIQCNQIGFNLNNAAGTWYDPNNPSLLSPFPNMWRIDEQHTHSVCAADYNSWFPPLRTEVMITNNLTEQNCYGYAINNNVPTTLSVSGASSALNAGNFTAIVGVENNSSDVAHNNLNLNYYGFEQGCTVVTSPINQNVGPYNPAGTGPTNGWHLIANPYASPVDWVALVKGGGVGANISHGISFFEPTSQYYGKYGSIQWNTVLNRIVYGGSFNPSQYIPSMQSFFIQNTVVGSPAITFKNAYRNVSGAALGGVFYKTEEATDYGVPSISLKGYKNDNAGIKDKAVIIFSPQSSETGVGKLMNTDENIPNIYSLSEQRTANSGYDVGATYAERGNYLSIQEISEFKNEMVIPLGFDVNSSGEYTINGSEIYNFPAGTHVYLVDMKNNAAQDLTVNPNYTFAINKDDVGETYAEQGATGKRFYLRFGQSLQTNASIAEMFDAYSDGNMLIVNYNNPANTEAILSVYNILGQNVTGNRQQAIGNGTSRLILGVAPGAYMVRLVTNDRVYIKKVYLQ